MKFDKMIPANYAYRALQAFHYLPSGRHFIRNILIEQEKTVDASPLFPIRNAFTVASQYILLLSHR